jgi:hypothetical protein
MNLQRRLAVSVVFMTLGIMTGLGNAQSTNKCDALARKVGCLFPTLLAGETVQSTTHDPSFPSGDFDQSLALVGTGIAVQLSSLPIPSTASGYTYTYERATGAFLRSSETFGPILAERGETLGRKRFYFGYGYQPFTFSTIDGSDLHNLNVVFKHRFDPDLNPEYLKDVITADNNISLNVRQFSTIFGYGVRDRLDVSVAIPVVSVHLNVVSADTIQRIGSKGDVDPMTGLPIHFFSNSPGDMSKKQFRASSSASGIGDVVVRAKQEIKNWEQTRLAFATDIRVPTGDEYNYLGSGAPGIKPFVVLSSHFNRIWPQLNVGFQWNGKSVLAGDLQTGDKVRLPYEIPYDAGVNIGVTKRLTVNCDIRGREDIHTNRFMSQLYNKDGVSFPDLIFKKSSMNVTEGAVGFKLNPVGNLVVHADLLIKMNDAGLRQTVTPLLGFTYTP